MALFMQPLSNGDEQAWKNVLNDYRKTRKERDLKKAELDRHIALSGYIMNGSTEEEAERKVNRSFSHINHSITVKYLGKVF